MKKVFVTLLCLLLAGLCACDSGVTMKNITELTAIEQTTETPTVTEEQTKSEAKTEHNDPFSSVIAETDWEHYVLYDTDGNGTYALFLGIKNPYGQIQEIYTLKNGVAERKLSVHNDTGLSAIVMWETGIISAGQANSVLWYYRFEGGQLKLITGFGSYGDGRGNFRVNPTGTDKDFFFSFSPDGTEIPFVSGSGEANALVREFEGDGERTELDWKPLAEYGRHPTEEAAAQTPIKTTEPEPAVTFASYDEILYDRLNNEGVYVVVRYYAFYDIDGNGVNELLIGAETYDGKAIMSIFTTQNGAAVRQEAWPGYMAQFPCWHLLYRNGTIRYEGTDEGSRGYGYFRFENGELKRLPGLSVKSGEYFRYAEDGITTIPISKEEFDRVQREMEGDGQIVELDWKPLAEYGQ